MSVKRTVRTEGGTLGDLRAFLAEVDRAGLPDDTIVHVKTRASMSPLGPTAKSLAAEGVVAGDTP